MRDVDSGTDGFTGNVFLKTTEGLGKLVKRTLSEEMTKNIPNVAVQSFDGLLIDYAKSVGATIIIRGLRAVTDFEYELQMAQTNRIVEPGVDTLFLTTSL